MMALGESLAIEPILHVRGLSKGYAMPRRRPWLKRDTWPALSDVSFELFRGEALGVVGESGSGKTTLARCLLRLLRPDRGSIRFLGRDLAALSGRPLRKVRRHIQVVFQDPVGSLDPRFTVKEIVSEGLKVHGPSGDDAAHERVARALTQVGLDENVLGRFPHEFSAGQRQRIALARALVLEPELLILDEPLSALDVSVQAQILAILRELRDVKHVSTLFISHDLRAVERLCERMIVLYLGRIVEIGPTRRVFDAPQHPYTRALLEAIPTPDPERGLPLDPLDASRFHPDASLRGCRYARRCPHAEPACTTEVPALQEIEPLHASACLRAPWADGVPLKD